MQNELAAQRVVRLLLAEPWLFYKDYNAVMSVLMVVPQNCGGGAPCLSSACVGAACVGAACVGGACGDDAAVSVGSSALINTTCTDSAVAGAAAANKGAVVCSERRNSGDSKTAAAAESGSSLSAAALRGVSSMRFCFEPGGPLAACAIKGSPNMQQQDRDVQLLIELSAEGLGLDIRSFPQQIVQLISADDADRDTAAAAAAAAGSSYFPQEDFTPHDSIILNSSTADMP